MPFPRRLLRLAFALLALPPLSFAYEPNAPVAPPPEAAPFAPDVLPRWRDHYPALQDLLDRIGVNLVAFESPDSPLPELSPELVALASALCGRFALSPGDTLGFEIIHGPETPFPDHQPLRQIAALRTFLARQALAKGDVASAFAHVRQNLAQARLTLRVQEGIIPLIHASGVWQSALDGVHALALSPTLTLLETRSLLDELLGDSGLAQLAASRALRGEYTHVYKVVVERMPVTDDPDLFLSSVSSLGMAPPQPLEPGELGLGLTTHPILDVPATLAAYEADLAPYLAHFARSSRLPRLLHHHTTARTLAAHRAELDAFYAYATGESPPSLAQATLARAALEAATNPGGKLLAVFLTPAWEMILGAPLRREAQRAALCGLLGWRIHGQPTPWEILVARGILPAAPADPYSSGPLLHELIPRPRVWSVFLDGLDGGGVLVDGNSGQPDDLVWPAAP